MESAIKDITICGITTASLLYMEPHQYLRNALKLVRKCGHPGSRPFKELKKCPLQAATDFGVPR